MPPSRFFLLLFVSFLLSCSVEKRLYTRGFSIHWIYQQKTEKYNEKFDQKEHNIARVESTKGFENLCELKVVENVQSTDSLNFVRNEGEKVVNNIDPIRKRFPNVDEKVQDTQTSLFPILPNNRMSNYNSDYFAVLTHVGVVISALSVLLGVTTAMFPWLFIMLALLGVGFFIYGLIAGWFSLLWTYPNHPRFFFITMIFYSSVLILGILFAMI